MLTKNNQNVLILKGKIKDVTEFLKSCENDYVYISDLIKALSDDKPKSLFN